MTGAVAVVGIDPGPVPGLVVLPGGDSEPWVVQCSAQLAPAVLQRLLEAELCCRPVLVGVEDFVVRGRAARSASAAAGAQTRDLIGRLEAVAWQAGERVLLHKRAAAQVKPWATDGRLAAAGLLEPTTGMRHARDAARHALFTAVIEGIRPDPLSKKVTT